MIQLVSKSEQRMFIVFHRGELQNIGLAKHFTAFHVLSADLTTKTDLLRLFDLDGERPVVVLFDPKVAKSAKLRGAVEIPDIEAWIGASKDWKNFDFSKERQPPNAMKIQLFLGAAVLIIVVLGTIAVLCRHISFWKSALDFGVRRRY
jgi:hypothetical protein